MKLQKVHYETSKSALSIRQELMSNPEKVNRQQKNS